MEVSLGQMRADGVQLVKIYTACSTQLKFHGFSFLPPEDQKSCKTMTSHMNTNMFQSNSFLLSNLYTGYFTDEY